MVTNSINLTIHETYDLNTKVDAVTLLAIRTPSYKTVEKYVSTRNWQKIKFNRASFRLACVSQLPVDPLGVGFEAGQVAPQELVNPMLFKTVTGESLGPILDVIYGSNATNDDGDSIKRIDAKKIVESSLSGNPTLSTTPLDMYYVLLGDDSFRQAHPQAGLTAHNIIPLVREMYTTMPISAPDLATPTVGIPSSNTRTNLHAVAQFDVGTGQIWANPGTDGLASAPGRIISGSTRPMPAIDTNAGSKAWNFEQSWPMSYCALCIMPPAIQKSLYYRCIVSWNITLSGFVPQYRQSAYLGTSKSNLYNDWVDRPVDPTTAQAMELWDDEGLIATDGAENVELVTQNLT